MHKNTATFQISAYIRRFLKYILSLLLFLTIVYYSLKMLPIATNVLRHSSLKPLEQETYENITKGLQPAATIAYIGGKPISKQDVDYKKKWK